MPRLPDDSPLLYSEKAGEYMPQSEWLRKHEQCSFCQLVRDGWERYVYGKWDTHECANFTCDECLQWEKDNPGKDHPDPEPEVEHGEGGPSKSSP